MVRKIQSWEERDRSRAEISVVRIILLVAVTAIVSGVIFLGFGLGEQISDAPPKDQLAVGIELVNALVQDRL
jgi:hypothetical protein